MSNSKRFYVFEEFDEIMAKDFVEWVHSHKDTVATTLKIYINSPGGGIPHLRAMLNAMKESSHKFHTIATGQAMSCGFMLLIAGDHRTIYDGTDIMSHQYSWGAAGKFHEIQETSKQFNITYDWMLEHYTKCSGKRKLPKKAADTLLGYSDYYPTPEELLQYGLIDEVI